jgi:transcriptional regulator with XRE-family HTH domain
MPDNDRPFANTKAAKFLDKRLSELAAQGKTQREIARQAGFHKAPNIISMFKIGDARIPLERVPALARAIEVDEMTLFRLVWDQNYAGTDLDDMVKRVTATPVTRNEAKWIELIRDITDNADPAPTEAMETAIREALSSWFAKNKTTA